MTGSIITQLIDFDRGDRNRVNHALKVTGYAMAIASGESIPSGDCRILEAAAVLHDVGILPAMAKYGHAHGHAQEEMGPPEARTILRGLGWGDDDILLVEYLVGHHHSYGTDGGPLLQILFEADFLVNIDEGAFPGQSPPSLRDRYFRTPSGIRIFNALYPASPSPEG